MLLTDCLDVNISDTNHTPDLRITGPRIIYSSVYNCGWNFGCVASYATILLTSFVLHMVTWPHCTRMIGVSTTAGGSYGLSQPLHKTWKMSAQALHMCQKGNAACRRVPIGGRGTWDFWGKPLCRPTSQHCALCCFGQTHIVIMGQHEVWEIASMPCSPAHMRRCAKVQGAHILGESSYYPEESILV